MPENICTRAAGRRNLRCGLASPVRQSQRYTGTSTGIVGRQTHCPQPREPARGIAGQRGLQKKKRFRERKTVGTKERPGIPSDPSGRESYEVTCHQGKCPGDDGENGWATLGAEAPADGLRRAKRIVQDSGDAGMKNHETTDGKPQVPPDRPHESAVNGTQYEMERENEELEWARRHIREGPAAPQPEPARSPDPKPEPEAEPEEKLGNAEPTGRAGRGKGRPPHRMLKEAVLIAKKRGGIIRVPGGRSDAFDMIICEECRNVYVRLRWSHTPYLSSRDVIGRYPRDIGRMVRLPQTRVMAWELWLREPQDLWQFFLISHNGIVEIRNDGTIYHRPLLPVPIADEARSSTDGGGCTDGDWPSPDVGT